LSKASIALPTPGLPAQTVDANFRKVADAFANSPTNCASCAP
jgi:hypothetical protein